MFKFKKPAFLLSKAEKLGLMQEKCRDLQCAVLTLQQAIAKFEAQLNNSGVEETKTAYALAIDRLNEILHLKRTQLSEVAFAIEILKVTVELDSYISAVSK